MQQQKVLNLSLIVWQEKSYEKPFGIREKEPQFKEVLSAPFNTLISIKASTKYDTKDY